MEFFLILCEQTKQKPACEFAQGSSARHILADGNFLVSVVAHLLLILRLVSIEVECHSPNLPALGDRFPSMRHAEFREPTRLLFSK